MVKAGTNTIETARNLVWDQKVVGSSPTAPTIHHKGLPGSPDSERTASSPVTTITPATVARFWAKVAMANPEDCWLWIGAVSKNGYGSFALGRGRTSAHRVAFRIATGAWPEGKLLIRHKCDTPLCCNPHHLETGTHVDNARDMVERGGWSNGDTSGERNGRARLTAENVATIREMLARGRTNTAIGKEFGVHHATISVIRRGKSWRIA